MTIKNSPDSAASGATKESIGFHYDIGREFYRLWLDDNMIYSAALYDSNDNLESAQIRKIDWHIDRSEISPHGRLLDIGCGWGGTMIRAQERHRSILCTGLTLSQDQFEFVQQLDEPTISSIISDWREYEPIEKFNSIISIGAFEHFSATGYSRSQKIRTYRDFFVKCRNWLYSGSCLSLQTIAFDRLDERTMSNFIKTQIFPDSVLPHTDEIFEASRGVFSVEELVNHAPHYARTCREWTRRVEECYDSCVAQIGKERTEEYLQYLKISASAFSQKGLMLLRIKLRAHSISQDFEV